MLDNINNLKDLMHFTEKELDAAQMIHNYFGE